MTPDERTALNEAVCKRLGWESETRLVLHKTYEATFWKPPGQERFDQPLQPDFTSDWNAVYRWIVPAVKEMRLGKKNAFHYRLFLPASERALPHEMHIVYLYATPEDYCRAFLAVTES